MSLFVSLQGILFGITGLLLVYLALLSVLAIIERSQTVPVSERFRQFAILIPAHNEEIPIRNTLQSLNNINYPEDNYTIFVIADNCTDDTAAIARSSGANVWERTDTTHRGKGYALRWAFQQILASPSRYDAVVVIDADSRALPNVLHVMNNHLEDGAQAIQGYVAIEPNSGVWSSEITRLGYTLHNYVRPLGKRALGFPSGLHGIGMCFTPEVLRSVPWEAYSTTEDLEYGLHLLLQGIEVRFAPELVGYSTLPEKIKHASSQRERWEFGRLPLIRKYAAQLLAAAFQRRSLRYLDAFADLVMPPLMNLLMLAGMMGVGNSLLYALNVMDAGVFVWGWFCLIGIGLIHLIGGLTAAYADLGLYRAVFYVPLYALWKLGLYMKVLIRGSSKEWVRTTREDPTLPKSV